MLKHNKSEIYTIAITDKDSKFIADNIDSFSNMFIAWTKMLNFHCDYIRRLYEERDPPYQAMKYIKHFDIQKIYKQGDGNIIIDIEIEMIPNDLFEVYDIPIYVVKFIITEAAKSMEKMFKKEHDSINKESTTNG